MRQFVETVRQSRFEVLDGVVPVGAVGVDGALYLIAVDVETLREFAD